MALTYQQMKLVKSTVPVLKESGELIATTFYRYMLAENPRLREVFNSVNQKSGRQPRALTQVMLSFANNVSHTSELIPTLEKICNKHCSLGIQQADYSIVGRYLILAFAHVLGPAWTPDVELAWTKAYWVLAKMMIARESQLYGEFGDWTSWRKFKISRKERQSKALDAMVSFYLKPVNGKRLPPFFPGQYVSIQVRVPISGLLQSRQYSLSEAPRREGDYYRITVKREEGGRYVGGGGGSKGSGSGSGRTGTAASSIRSISTTSTSSPRPPSATEQGPSYTCPGVVSNLLIDEMGEGDVVEVSHPSGEFFLDTNNDSSVPLVLISAGAGVTPMISILNSVLETQPSRDISWIQGVRHTVPFEEHVRQIKRTHPNVRTNVFKTELADGELTGATLHGRMDLAKVSRADLFLDHGAADFRCCGPEAFMIAVAQYLRDEKVEPSRIKFELFSTGVMASTA
ncbi:hypothetical protein RB597_004149 [Gaeumannomyces tritici]